MKRILPRFPHIPSPLPQRGLFDFSTLRLFDSPDEGERRSAFTLIELLAVIAIIGILAGMMGSAAYAAKQNSYRAQAAAETREIANACRSFWVASGSWSGGSRWPGSGTDVHIKQNDTVYDTLTGKNPAKTVFLEFDEQRFDENNEYLDPWGNPYEIDFDSTDPVKRKQTFSTSVTFPMRYRYKYYGNQFAQ